MILIPVFEAMQWISNPIEIFAKLGRFTLCNVNKVGMGIVVPQFAYVLCVSSFNKRQLSSGKNVMQ